ncbi:uncharacterized protein LOC144141751 [Haemaphysalis longicornis]
MASEPGGYAAALNEIDRARYEQKTALCGVDPFVLGEADCATSVELRPLWPRVDDVDIVDFLVLRTSFVTLKQLKCRKALEGHNFLTSGWVREPWLKQVSADTVIIVSKVNHSQNLSVPPVQVWTLVKSDGEVIAAHCSCMAGIGEACSHVAALLFYLECVARARKDRSCTDGANLWLPPHLRKLPVRPIAEMDFSSATMKKRRLDSGSAAVSAPTVTSRPTAPAATKAEWRTFFAGAIEAGHRPAAASVDLAFKDVYLPAVRSCRGADLRRMYEPGAQDLSWAEVEQRCDQVYDSLDLNDKAVGSIEARTRKQSMSTQWYDYRAGRITASTLYDVCHTKLERPSLSLVKRICYPHSNKVHSDAIKYGRENEGNALASYRSLALQRHDSVEFKDAGFLISQKYVFLGATPDMLVKCSCCGEGIVEVKCPWSARERNLADLANETNSCVVENGGILELKSSHRYFYQVQLQLFVWQVDYCDFVLWNHKEINVQRVAADEQFLLPLLPVAERFFRKVLLPELVGRVFTRPNENRPPAVNGCASPDGADLGARPTQVGKSDQYCSCKGPEQGKMIACDGPRCPIIWYHFRCVGLKREPKAKKWFCSSCKT